MWRTKGRDAFALSVCPGPADYQGAQFGLPLVSFASFFAGNSLLLAEVAWEPRSGVTENTMLCGWIWWIVTTCPVGSGMVWDGSAKKSTARGGRTVLVSSVGDMPKSCWLAPNWPDPPENVPHA